MSIPPDFSSDILPGQTLALCQSAERQLIGCLLNRPDFLHEVTSVVSGDSFFDRSFGAFFTALSEAVRKGIQCDPWTLGRLVFGEHARATLEEIVSVISSIKADTQSPAHVRFFAEEVANWAAYRAVRTAGFDLIKKTSECTDAPKAKELLAESAKAIQEASVVNASEALDLGEVASAALERISRAMESQTSSGLPTGLVEIDSRWGGLYDGELTVLAARPSIGKSALGLSIALNIAEQGKSVFFVSLEMTREQIGYRILARQTGISCDRQRMGSVLSVAERSRLENARDQVRSWPLRVWCSSGVTVGEIESRARLHATKMGLDCIVVDYMGLGKLRPIGRHQTTNDQISEIVHDLASMSKRMVKPVLALCQLNRSAEGVEPGLQNLRDSGSIEQDADCIWFLHRERGKSETTFIVAKCRNAEIGRCDLVFDGDRATFYDPAPTYTNFSRDF